MGYIEIIRPVRTAVARGPGARPRRGRRRRQGPTVDRFGAGWATGRGHERTARDRAAKRTSSIYMRYAERVSQLQYLPLCHGVPMDVLTRQGAVLMPMIGWMEHDVTQQFSRSEKSWSASSFPLSMWGNKCRLFFLTLRLTGH